MAGRRKRGAAHATKTPGVRPLKNRHPKLLPPIFFDRLSQRELSPELLKEQARRQEVAGRASAIARKHPQTRLARAQWKEKHSGADEFLRSCSESTRQHLQHLASLGEPELGDLRGFRKPIPVFTVQSFMDPKDTQPLDGSKGTISPYNRHFRQHLLDWGIFTAQDMLADGSEPPAPRNLDAILDMLDAEPSSSVAPSAPSGADFAAFSTAYKAATSESHMMMNVIPLIERHGSVPDASYAGCNTKLGNLDHLTDGTLVAGRPDLYYGAWPAQLRVEVRNALGNFVIPSSTPHRPAAPNFFLEAKGTKGTLEVATLQACYDGCLGARGIERLRAHGRQGAKYEGNAYTLVATVNAGSLFIYSVHCEESPTGRIEYYMRQLNGWCLTGNARAFKQGVAAYHNAKEWARQQRDEAIAMANETVDWDSGAAQSMKQ